MERTDGQMDGVEVGLGSLWLLLVCLKGVVNCLAVNE